MSTYNTADYCFEAPSDLCAYFTCRTCCNEYTFEMFKISPHVCNFCMSDNPMEREEDHYID